MRRNSSLRPPRAQGQTIHQLGRTRKHMGPHWFLGKMLGVSKGQRTVGWGRSTKSGQERLFGEETCDKAPKNVNELDLEV